MTGKLFIISAPSGGGKTSLIKEILTKIPNLVLSISHTTRAPRPGEVHGKNYFFVSEAEFLKLQKEGDFLESAKVFDNYYGTSKKWVKDQLQKNNNVILEIDWQGANIVRQQLATIGIFILPPSKEVLAKRLAARQQDSVEVISKRMQKAGQEISHYAEYDYIVINDSFEQAASDLVSIIKDEKISGNLTIAHQKERIKTLVNELIGE